MLSAIFCAVPAPMRVEPAITSGGVGKQRSATSAPVEQRRAVIVGDARWSSRRAARASSQRADRIGRRAAGRHGDQAVAAAESPAAGNVAAAPGGIVFRRAGQVGQRCRAAGEQDDDAVAGNADRCREVRARRPAPSGRNCRPPHRRAGRRRRARRRRVAAASAMRRDGVARPTCAASTWASASKRKHGRRAAGSSSPPACSCTASVRGRAITVSSARATIPKKYHLSSGVNEFAVRIGLPAAELHEISVKSALISLAIGN